LSGNCCFKGTNSGVFGCRALTLREWQNGRAFIAEISMREGFSKRFIREGINCLTIEQ
jgi:hypothetical protein